MTREQTLAAIFLSILSSPVKLGLYENPGRAPDEIIYSLRPGEYKVQDHIAGIYGEDPARASELIAEKCLRKNITIVSCMDKSYPALLREIHRPPLALYLKGKLPQKRMISIVGTRNSDRQSEEITLKISSTLSVAGYCIVSGMAYGIDRFAHLGALDSGGTTVGVLPGGIDTIYPYRNRDIYNMISDSGASALISEYPPGIPPGQKWTFAQRNRIISGVSSALVVVQAPRGSGAMITARHAIEQNRDLFVCPGHAFDERYEGCHDLIRDGAMIVSRVEDILSEIDPGYKENAGYSDAAAKYLQTGEEPGTASNECSPHRDSADIAAYSGIERELLESIYSGNTDIDLFTRKFSYTPDQVNRAVTVLEIEGVITRKGNNLLIK